MVGRIGQAEKAREDALNLKKALTAENSAKQATIVDLESRIASFELTVKSQDDLLALKDSKIQSLQQLLSETEQHTLQIKNEITHKFKQFFGQGVQNVAQATAESQEERRQSILPIDELRLQLQAEKQLNLLLQSKVDLQMTSMESLQSQQSQAARENEELQRKLE